jgi:hypothetical protein
LGEKGYAWWFFSEYEKLFLVPSHKIARLSFNNFMSEIEKSRTFSRNQSLPLFSDKYI